jgi:hypothetical protein
LPLFRVIPACEDGQIRTSDTEETAVLYALNGGVDEWRCRAVWIEVDDFYAIRFEAVVVDQGAETRVRDSYYEAREPGKGGKTHFASPSLTTTPVF